MLVTGPRGSGKSTLLSALVDLVNRQRAEFVITLERQIRLVHDNRSALVSQREIRGGADDTVAAARSALREGRTCWSLTISCRRKWCRCC